MRASTRLPSHVKPQRYQINLRPDLENFTFEGEETIFVILAKPLKEITLHSAELEIFSDEAKVTYQQKNETATLTYPKQIPAGKHEIKLKFTGVLNDKMRGFYRSRYDIEQKVKYLAITQFESTDARRAFPCFDEPSQKAIFDVTLMIPGGTTAISNTVVTDIKEHESGYQIVNFAPTPKMSTYLLAFIVGEFESIEGKTKDGILVRVFTTPGKKHQAKFSLDVAIKCLEFYQDYFKFPYPLPVMDLIAIPDFAAGAMENWGAVTYRESTLLVDETSTSTGNKQWVAMVIAHELAHQWFGNLVTMQWWTHLWLNEGFATFIEYLAINHIFPEWDTWTQFVSHEAGIAYSLDALENTHPIQVEVHHTAEISEIFDTVSYAKGASVLRMLMSYLGEKSFQKGLQQYLKKHAYGNAKTEDLWQALEKASGKPVGKVMQNWVGKAGHPIIRVQGIGSRVQLTQSRFFSSAISKKASKDNTIWSIPLNGQLMDKETISMNLQGKLNLGETSFVQINYPTNYLAKLSISKLSAVDRLGLIRDSFSLSQPGESSTVEFLELAQSYKDEEDYTVWIELTGYIGQLEGLLAYEAFYPQIKEYGRSLYQEIAQKLGWDKKPGEKHTDPLLRSIALYKLGSYGDQATIKKAQELFRSSLRAKRSNLEPDLRAVVYNLVAENGGITEFNQLVDMYKHEDNHQEKDRLGRALGLFPDKDILKKALDFALSEDVRYQSSLGIIASVWRNPEGRYLAWEYVKSNWKLLKDRYAGGHYYTRLFGPCGDFTKISDAKDIENFVRKNPAPEAQRTIAQALEQIYSNADWLKRDGKKIEKFLSSW